MGMDPVQFEKHFNAKLLGGVTTANIVPGAILNNAGFHRVDHLKDFLGGTEADWPVNERVHG